MFGQFSLSGKSLSWGPTLKKRCWVEKMIEVDRNGGVCLGVTPVILHFMGFPCINHPILRYNGWWFFATPLKNIWLRQLGWWNSQYIETYKKCSKPPIRVHNGYIVGTVIYRRNVPSQPDQTTIISYGSFHSHGDTPSHHPFIDGFSIIFPKTIQLLLGVSPKPQQSSKSCTWRFWVCLSRANNFLSLRCWGLLVGVVTGKRWGVFRWKTFNQE